MRNRKRTMLMISAVVIILQDSVALQGGGLFRRAYVYRSPPTMRKGKELFTNRLSSKLLSSGSKNENSSEIINGKRTATREEMKQLQRENQLLRATIQRLEGENERLQQYASSNRIVLESFEGEGRLQNSEALVDAPVTLLGDQIIGEELWCDSLEEDECPVEPAIGFSEALRDRAYWLVGLLAMQSCSGIILARNEALLANHPVIVYFLTMLVGAGGNAGNQASVRVIRGLALGTLNDRTQGQFLQREVKMASALSAILACAGFIRAVAFHTPLPEAIAVTAALLLIVFSSVCLGAVLPLGLKRIGVDPAHSSTSIQVIMDILGVFLAVAVSSLVLDSPLGAWIISFLGVPSSSG